MNKRTPEYKSYSYLKLWEKEESLEVLKEKSKHYGDLFLTFFPKVAALYKKLPKRKNGKDSLIHPLNVVYALVGAGVTDERVLVAALLHDYIEEQVDLYKKEHGLKKSKGDLKKLAHYQKEILVSFKEELDEVTTPQDAHLIYTIVFLLTRNKTDNYYQSISYIFQHPNKEERDLALQVKLADRIHNILSIETFNERERLYQCFKNLFILNNTKKYLMECFGKDEVYAHPVKSPFVLLYKRCAKATYTAFMNVCGLCVKKGVGEVKPLLILALKKFSLERAGVWEVTKENKKEMHLMRIFHGLIQKYDARLHREMDRFEKHQQNDYNFLAKFFVDFSFSKEQLEAIIDYKDAYALREVMSYLIYLEDYTLSGFLVSQLTKKGRICY